MTVTDVISLIGFFCIFLFCFIIPRYYACLCGHHELVEYLLQNGQFHGVESGYQLCGLKFVRQRFKSSFIYKTTMDNNILYNTNSQA